MIELLLKFVYALAVVIAVMTFAGYSVLAERKVSSWIQGRVGPNRTKLPLLSGVPVLGRILTRLGLFQLPADGLKFLFKEDPVPAHVNKPYYYLAPLIALIPALMTITVVPFGVWYGQEGARPLVLANIDLGILFIFAVSSLGVYGIVLAGWAANSKYPFLGGIRSSAQMISYELAMGLSILPVFMMTSVPGGLESSYLLPSENSLSLANVVVYQEGLWLLFLQPVSALIFLVSLFAETNRLPFDMPESETELVGGFHTEYGSFKFGLFFVSEYAHMFIGSAVFTLLFFGGWNFLPGLADPWPENWFGSVLSIVWFIIKTLGVVFFFMWVRWTLPRYRYDQVMALGWKALLPLAIANLLFYAIVIAVIDTV
jgi:NADH-quinone oxidoreductase subunit H